MDEIKLIAELNEDLKLFREMVQFVLTEQSGDIEFIRWKLKRDLGDRLNETKWTHHRNAPTGHTVLSRQTSG